MRTKDRKSARRTAGAAPAGGQKPPRPWHPFAIWGALVVVTLAAYAPVWHGGLLWDDAAHLTAEALRPWSGLPRIWFEIGATQQYYPVVHSAFWLFHQFWGDQTLGYHLANIVLHATSAFLVLLLLRRLKIPGAPLAALIFALHPVHVESVAWITELKNTLSGVFYFGAALAYLRFDERRTAGTYAGAMGLFLLALFSKTVTATLPGALAVVLWWRRGSLSLRRDVAPLVPFLMVGIAGGLVTAWVETTFIGASGNAFQFTLLERGLIASRALWFYLGKLLWPADLVFSYERWDIGARVWWQYAYPIAAIALLAVLWRFRSRSRAPIAAALVFGGTLVPALGFVNVYPFRYSFVADHFQYLASVAIIVLVAAALARWTAQSRAAAIAAGVVIGAVLFTMTWRRTHDFVDADTLYRATLARNPASALAHLNLGSILAERGQVAEAVSHFAEAARLEPDWFEPHVNVGRLRLAAGDPIVAEREYREAVRLKPEDAKAHAGLGKALGQLGRTDEGLAQLRESMRLDAGDAEAHNNLGLLLDDAGHVDEAITEYTAAVRLDPSFGEAYNNLGSLLASTGKVADAVPNFQQAIRLYPDDAAAHRNLGSAWAHLKRPNDAIREFRETIRLNPNQKDVRTDLATLLASQGALAEAYDQLEAALVLDPADPVLRERRDRLAQLIKKK